MRLDPMLEHYRVKGDGQNGVFDLRTPDGRRFTVICSDGLGWEHVSVSMKRRCPTWEEMCWVKDLFFAEDETVMQLHPPKSENISNHNFCLHLWRPLEAEIPRPGAELVGLDANAVREWLRRGALNWENGVAYVDAE